MDVQLETLKRVVEAAQAYVAVVNDPPLAPSHKVHDAERQAFMDLEDAVQVAVDAIKAARAARDPDAEGAWS
jgi:hypothetical protein